MSDIVDTGAEVSIVPPTGPDLNKSSSMNLIAANGSRISAVSRMSAISDDFEDALSRIEPVSDAPNHMLNDAPDHVLGEDMLNDAPNHVLGENMLNETPGFPCNVKSRKHPPRPMTFKLNCL